MSNDDWCEPDGCPAAICGGPHIEVETTLGVELIRPNQEPIGTPLAPAAGDPR